MSALSLLKEFSTRPFFRSVPTDLYGSVDSWRLVRGSLTAESKILSAGVGQSITFEEDIVRRHNSRIVLLDPSETGIRTMQARAPCSRLAFRDIGLAGTSGVQYFGSPDLQEEGSFRKGTEHDGVSFRCVTVADVMREENFSALNLLKIDIEGFEYEVLDSLLRQHLAVEQICLELHTDKQITIQKTVFHAYAMIARLYANGYRIVYNKAMDFTFASVRLLRNQGY